MKEYPLSQPCDEPQYPLVCAVTISQGLTKQMNAEIWDYYHGSPIGRDEWGDLEYEDDTSATDWESECRGETPRALMERSRKMLLALRDCASDDEKKEIDRLAEKLAGWEEEYYDCENK